MFAMVSAVESTLVMDGVAGKPFVTGYRVSCVAARDEIRFRAFLRIIIGTASRTNH